MGPRPPDLAADNGSLTAREQGAREQNVADRAAPDETAWNRSPACPDARSRAVPDGFVELFDAECARIVRFATLLGADDPEDIAQEAFCKLLVSWHRIRDEDPAPYLRRIVLNATRARIRHLRMARLRQPWADPPAASAEDSVLDASERRGVAHALRYLSPRQREAIVLRYWLDLPNEQIARVMKVSPGTVKSQVSRGVRRLEKILRSQS